MNKLNSSIVFFIGFLIQFQSATGQSAIFTDIYLEPDTIQSGKFKNYEAYDLGYLTLYKLPRKAEKFIIATRSTDVEIFSFKKPNKKGYLTKPHFFKSEVAGQPTIMIADVSDLYSFGVHIFLIDEDMVTHCGFLGYAADNFNFSSLWMYSHFELQGDKIIYTMDNVAYIDHANEELVYGSDLKFEITDHSVERIITEE